MGKTIPRPHAVIIGGGFAGLSAGRALKRVPVDVTLIDRRNSHLFQPLLYQEATGELSPSNISSPLRSLLRKQKNARVLMGRRHNWKLKGIIAWLLWLFVHLMYIARFRNRVLVLVQWGWTFFTHDRSSSLIAGAKVPNPSGTGKPPRRQLDDFKPS